MIEYSKTKFIDSFNYFQMKLSKLPATFGLPESNKKGYFPHLFNRLENQEYVGPLPDSSFYSPDTMSASERIDFLTWYDEQLPHYRFDFKKEIFHYCRMDVVILRRACVAFRKIFLDLGNTDPFVSATTMASACSYLYRKNFLKPNTIGLPPPNGYRRSDKHSQKAVEWLLHCERELGCPIIHAGRAREFRLAEGFLVDGYLLNNTVAGSSAQAPSNKGIVFEYQGCYSHGCIKCYKSNCDKLTSYNRTLDEAYESTCAKIKKIRLLGYEVREMWECEFDRLKLENSEISKNLNNHPLITKMVLNPRDAFFGGRTENVVAHYEAKEGETIRYTDICSLYPYICKTGRFPLGHPKIYVGNECDLLTGGDINDLSKVEGLVKCKVLPPRDLFLPLLPMKMHNRLLFALCRTCCEEMQQGACTHEDASQREFAGTWVVEELRKAIEIGYVIRELQIIWQYEITQYDARTGEGGLFANYVNTFLKIKQEASGWPEDVVTETDKERYLYEYEQAEGIKLQREKIGKNAGLRAVAKLCLNSFWGKFGQRSNLKQTDIIKTREALLQLLLAPEKEVFDILFVNDELLYVNWQYIEDAVESAPNTNVIIAAYTTAQARLKLYSYLEKLDRRVLYFDTDSCIFVCNDSAEGDGNEYRPHLGSLLGDMTDELTRHGPHVHIKTFLSGGPKFYAYRAVDASTGNTFDCCKVKGISLNYNNALKINFDSIKSLIKNYFDESERKNIKINFRAIRRMPAHVVVTRDEFKTCCIILKKRRYISPEVSLPYGYKS